MVRGASIVSSLSWATALVVAVLFCLPVCGQSVQQTAPKPANVVGTVTDTNGGPVPGATVTLDAPQEGIHRTLVTPENGYFEFNGLKPGIPYQINITAKDFESWTSPTLTLEPGQFKIVTGIQLPVQTARTSVRVTYDPVEVATEQLKSEEKQRIFGIIPNFYVAYEKDAAPLTTKMKFKLALKVSYDPVTAAGILFLATAKQAANSPNYGQGWGPFGERVGAMSADSFTDIMFGGAILPSLLHQDPRYFYQGTGTTRSRMRHAMISPFVARGDNGKWQPNYSSIGGDLISSSLSNLYYPKSNRGAGVVFSGFAIGTAERVGAGLAQEFLIGKLTRRGGKMQ